MREQVLRDQYEGVGEDAGGGGDQTRGRWWGRRVVWDVRKCGSGDRRDTRGRVVLTRSDGRITYGELGKKNARAVIITCMDGVSWMGCKMEYHRCTLCGLRGYLRGEYFV